MIVGTIYVFVGLTFFLMGLEQALFPVGRAMAEQLTTAAMLGIEVKGAAVHWTDYGWIYSFAAAIGFATTLAEPSVIALSLKARDVTAGAVSALGLRLIVASGVAVGVAMGAVRIVSGVPLSYCLVGGYALLLVQTLSAPKIIVPLAYDAGGVTTSMVSVPMLLALGLGLAGSIPGRSLLLDGFGLIAFASLFPIMSVLAYAWAADRWSRSRSKATPKG
jgi:hypothetical protein